MYPDYLITIGGKGYVTLYGTMIAIGILCCFITLTVYVKKKNVDEKIADFVFYVAIIAIALGFLSATLFQSVYNYIEDPSHGFEFGGMTFIGGLIGGVGVFLIIYFSTKNNIRKDYKGSLIDIMPVVPCCITVAHGFGRIGCFFAGCCYGKETSGPLGRKFPDLKNPFKVNTKGNLNMGIYCIGYGIFRFLIEFLRGDDRGKLFNLLSPSQFWSIVMIIIGVFLIFALPKIEAAIKAKRTVGQTDDNEQAEKE